MQGPLVRRLAFMALVYAVACGRSERAVDAPMAALPAAIPAVPPPVGEGADGAEPLPADIPIPDGLRSVSVTATQPGALVALFTGDLDPEEVARGFAEGLKGAGWSVDQSRSTGSDLGLLARKDQRTASVVVTRLSGRLHVELGVWSPR